MQSQSIIIFFAKRHSLLMNCAPATATAPAGILNNVIGHVSAGKTGAERGSR
jgi:hypothetical protein